MNKALLAAELIALDDSDQESIHECLMYALLLPRTAELARVRSEAAAAADVHTEFYSLDNVDWSDWTGPEVAAAANLAAKLLREHRAR